jgi:G3E family GTPase
MSDDECPELVSGKVPVTILTGFLGSGKTTLLHYILTEQHNLKIAVIVNEFEFGKSIEKGLTLKSSEKSDDEWLELNNGCMCCTAQSQAVMALEKLMMRKGSFDLILIETSGLADPGPIAANFWQDDALCAMLQLSGIVAVVDSKNISKYLADTDVQTEVSRQLLMADRIVLNKTDLVSADELNAVSAELATWNGTASQLHTSFCKLSPDVLKQLLFINTTNDASILQTLPAHRHSTITSVAIEVNNASVASSIAVDFLCRDLLYDESQPFEVVRCKAAIWSRDGAARANPDDEEGASGSTTLRVLQLQSIGEMFDVRAMECATVPLRCNRFLVLGRNLDEALIRRVIEKHFEFVA